MASRLVLVIAAALMLCASAAEAAPWKRVTTSDGSNSDQVGLARTPNGALQVVWHHRTGPSSEDLLRTQITAAGVVGATTRVLTGWVGVQNAAVVVGSESHYGPGLWVFFGGQRSTDTSDPFIGLNTAFLWAQGGGYTLALLGKIASGGQPYGSPVAATVLVDGTLLQAWAGTLGTWVHSGLNAATQLFNYQTPLGNYGYDVGMVGGSKGTMAWYSNATGHLGVYAQSVNSNGSPGGALMRMPGTGNMRVGMIGRTPIAVAQHPVRPGLKISREYVAYATGYPALNAIRLWRVGASSSRVLARTKRTGNTTATLATDSNGRIWVAWTNMVGSVPHVFARRSNRTGSIFGAVVDAGRPPGTPSIYRLDANATTAALDLFANAGVGLTASTATSYRRTLPGLTLGAAPRPLPRGKATDVVFRVLDAGDPVAGATVKAAGRSGLTNASGKVTLRIPARTRALQASARAPRYVGAAITLRVRRR